MQPTVSLANRLSRDYPDLHFLEGSEFRWSPNRATIFYESNGDPSLLLHELSHALLDHSTFTRDIKLIEMERDAWHHAQTILSPQYKVIIDSHLSEEALSTYRDWLHARSTCPECQATGIQVRKNTYKCLACHTLWKVNDARICSLRRYILNKKYTL